MSSRETELSKFNGGWFVFCALFGQFWLALNPSLYYPLSWLVSIIERPSAIVIGGAAVCLVLDYILLFRGGEIVGHFSNLGKKIVVLFVILYPQWAFLSLVAYFFGIVPYHSGSKIKGLFVLFILSPTAFALWGVGMLFSLDVFSFRLGGGTWKDALCGECGKELGYKLIDGKGLCGPCIMKFYPQLQLDTSADSGSR